MTTEHHTFDLDAEIDRTAAAAAVFRAEAQAALDEKARLAARRQQYLVDQAVIMSLNEQRMADQLAAHNHRIQQDAEVAARARGLVERFNAPVQPELVLTAPIPEPTPEPEPTTATAPIPEPTPEPVDPSLADVIFGQPEPIVPEFEPPARSTFTVVTSWFRSWRGLEWIIALIGAYAGYKISGDNQDWGFTGGGLREGAQHFFWQASGTILGFVAGGAVVLYALRPAGVTVVREVRAGRNNTPPPA